MKLIPQRKILDNGLHIIYYQSPYNPFIAFRGSLKAGAASEDQRGVAEFTSRLLLSGTKTRDASQLADMIEKLGATIDFRNSEEAVHFFGRCPRSTSLNFFKIFMDILSNPSFPNSEVERVRGGITDDIRMDLDNTSRQAIHELLGGIYPHHVYGRDPRGEQHDVKRVEHSNIKEFHSSHYGPNGMIIALAGDVDQNFIEKKIAPCFLKFEGESEALKLPTPHPANKIFKVIPMLHKSQADIALGLRAIPRNHVDFHALGMVNLLFGRIGLYGRLGQNIRDEQGLAYYSYSTLNSKLVGGHWNVIAGVNPGNLQKALDSIKKEIERLHNEPLTKQEIKDGKDNQVGVLKVALERNAEIAAELHRIEYFGLELDYLEKYPNIINELSTSQIHQAAEKYIRLEDCTIAIAGPVPKSLKLELH